MYAFHVDVPQGVSGIDVDYQYLSGRTEAQGIEITGKMLDLSWNEVVLYPAGHYSRQITYAPSVKLPQGWQFGTAHWRRIRNPASTTTFKPTTLNTLVDSPIYAGLYFKRVDLDPGARTPVHLDLFGDAPKDIEMTPQQLHQHRNLVAQAYKLFDSHHYDHYDFLFSLSDQLDGNGTRTPPVQRRRHWTRTTSRIGTQAHPSATCSRTNSHIRGTASSAVRPTCGRPISTCRWATR